MTYFEKAILLWACNENACKAQSHEDHTESSADCLTPVDLMDTRLMDNDCGTLVRLLGQLLVSGELDGLNLKCLMPAASY
jgi:hypothetical protein